MNAKRLGRIESEINRVLSDAIYNGIKDNRIDPSVQLDIWKKEFLRL